MPVSETISFIERASTILKRFDNFIQAPTHAFKELLKLMLCDVKMGKTGLKEPVKLRNAIIHSGIATARPGTLHKMYDSVQDILREYVLRLLNYKGQFFGATR